MRQFDIDWMLEQCRLIVLATNKLDKIEYKSIISAMNEPNILMPKQSTGKRNNVMTMCEGVIKNFGSGQYDFSDKTCAGIQEAFRVANEHYEIELVEFEEVQVLPKIDISQKEKLPESAIGEFFEIESITFQYRRHR